MKRKWNVVTRQGRMPLRTDGALMNSAVIDGMRRGARPLSSRRKGREAVPKQQSLAMTWLSLIRRRPAPRCDADSWPGSPLLTARVACILRPIRSVTRSKPHTTLVAVAGREGDAPEHQYEDTERGRTTNARAAALDGLPPRREAVFHSACPGCSLNEGALR
jgi:hypothetical protein